MKRLVLFLFIVFGQIIIWDLWRNWLLNIANLMMWAFALKVTAFQKRESL